MLLVEQPVCREIFGDLHVNGLSHEGGARDDVAAAGGQIDLEVLILFIALRAVVHDDVIRRDAIRRQALHYLVDAVAYGDLAPPGTKTILT